MNTIFALTLLCIALPFILDYLSRSTPVPTLSFAGPMAMAMAGVEPTSSTAPSTDVEDVEDEDNDFHPFDARELPNVLDRVVTPVTIEVLNGDGYVRHVVHSVERNPYNGAVDVYDGKDDHVVTLDGFAQVELVGPVTVLDAPREVLAYYADGELLCAEHGAPFDIGLSDGEVSPIFEGQNLDAVEWCSAGFDHGHSFCGSCGTHVEPKGHPDSGFNGPFFICDNCSTQAVYVDGDGYQYVDGFDDLTDSHNVTITLDAAQCTHPFGWSSRLNPVPSGTVGAVLDASGRTWTASWGFVCYLDDNPSAGTVLILAESTNTAWEYACDHDPFVAVLEEALADYNPDIPEDVEDAEEVRADFHASLQMIRVRLGDAVTVTRK